MEMSATIYVTGTLSLLLLLLSRGAAMEQEPIQIYYGTDDERVIYNETTINVTDTGSLLRLRFVADPSRIGELISDTSTLSTSYKTVIQQRSSVTEPMTDTHLLQVTESGSMMVQGLQHSSGNTDYTIILYFDVQSDPTEAPTTTAAATTTEAFTTTTTTQGGVTTSHAVNTAATVQIQKSTFVPVVIVVIVIALVLFTVSIVAIATTIHYRKRLKDLQQQNAATQVDQC